MNNQECRVRPQIVNINSDEPAFFLLSIKTSKCSGSCDDVKNPCCKNLNIRAFNLMSRANERRHIEWHETSKCKCILDVSVFNNKQSWNNDKCRCECDKGVCNKRFIWNPSNCECESDESYDVGE